ncbi:hypothetical protein GUITHDRAFT_106205 [Guillardia theta CCMP2712]|uniref:Uncharacterized protein n=1 Tax=Guillardia theta (strain CCMP2712) TaxID=905079 RepID=L1JHX6_GUITC|nr:hypothetical protein GUITHDRAFT_106205 [Guillardia theta CCMP2712]EKX48128.1 hypothetical protein GUITHDRAFT_106205 [Guillardia theta CCMP2712]|eukprot:XP_005835108.1 hypothetical protein GUITHDRAFT_106205 [Guillardia theta CCMP2712]
MYCDMSLFDQKGCLLWNGVYRCASQDKGNCSAGFVHVNPTPTPGWSDVTAAHVAVGSVVGNALGLVDTEGNMQSYLGSEQSAAVSAGVH